MMCRIVETTMTKNGVRKAKLVKMGQPITMGEWSSIIPAEVSLRGVALHEVYDKDMDVYSMEVSWMARELVRLENELTVWWWLGGMSIGFGLQCAASLYFEELGRMPEHGLTLKLPKKYEPVVDVEYKGQVGSVKVGVAGWVPWGFVVAGGS